MPVAFRKRQRRDEDVLEQRDVAVLLGILLRDPRLPPGRGRSGAGRSALRRKHWFDAEEDVEPAHLGDVTAHDGDADGERDRESSSPTGPHSQVQKSAAAMMAIAESPALRP